MHNSIWKLSKMSMFPSAVCQNGCDIHSKCTQNTRLAENLGRAFTCLQRLQAAFAGHQGQGYQWQFSFPIKLATLMPGLKLPKVFIHQARKIFKQISEANKDMINIETTYTSSQQNPIFPIPNYNRQKMINLCLIYQERHINFVKKNRQTLPFLSVF